MSSNDAQAASSRPTAEATRSRSETLLKISEECVSGVINDIEMARQFKDAGASAFETNVYAKLVSDRRNGKDPSGSGALPDDPKGDDRVDEDSNADDQEALEARQAKAVEDAAWAAIFERASSGRLGNSPQVPHGTQFDLPSLLRGLQPRAPGGLSTTVLAGAPHLANVGAPTGDPILDETTRLKELFTAEKAIEAIVSKMRSHASYDSVPQSICRDIVNDKYVDFAKLHASLEPSYNHDDDVKDLAIGEDTYSVVKKDSISKSKPVLTESHWSHLFDAWESAVILVFPHRKDELSIYKRFVVELFQNMSYDPALAIRIDQNIRFEYSKSPFRMDNENKFNRVALPHIRLPASSSSSGSLKRPSSSTSQKSQKRSTTICENWNSNRCASDPCENHRIHGRCSECDQNHRAFDNVGCKAAFETRKGAGRIANIRGGSGGRARA
jgi:hypothetical protein